MGVGIGDVAAAGVLMDDRHASAAASGNNVVVLDVDTARSIAEVLFGVAALLAAGDTSADQWRLLTGDASHLGRRTFMRMVAEQGRVVLDQLPLRAVASGSERP